MAQQDISNVRVSIESLNVSATTNSSGRCTLNVSPGTYDVKFEHDNYETKTVSMTIGNSGSSQEVQLTRKSSSSSGSGEIPSGEIPTGYGLINITGYVKEETNYTPVKNTPIAIDINGGPGGSYATAECITDNRGYYECHIDVPLLIEYDKIWGSANLYVNDPEHSATEDINNEYYKSSESVDCSTSTGTHEINKRVDITLKHYIISANVSDNVTKKLIKDKSITANLYEGSSIVETCTSFSEGVGRMQISRGKNYNVQCSADGYESTYVENVGIAGYDSGSNGSPHARFITIYLNPVS